VFQLQGYFEFSTIIDFIAAFLYVVLGFVIAKLTAGYTSRILKGKIPQHLLAFTSKVVFYIIFLISVILALIVLGAEKYITGILVAGGVVGVILGFASEKAVSNFISGIFLLVDRPLNIGEPVKIKNEAGIVTDISFLSTKIKTWDGRYVRFPNSEVFNATITNYGKYVARRLDMTVGVAYKEDPYKVVETVKKAVEEHPYVLAEPEPEIFVESLGESSVNIAIRVWVPSPIWFKVKKEIASIIKSKLEREGIEIPFPQIVVWFRTPLELKQG